MFCKNCGTENPDNARFCKACGAALEEDQASAYPAPAQPEEIAVQPAVYEQPAAYEQPADTAGEQPGERTIQDFEAVIGNNTEYYMPQFRALDQGMSANFNWAAFFLSIFHSLYRRSFGIFIKFMLVPVILDLASLLLFVGSIGAGIGGGAIGVGIGGTVFSFLIAMVAEIWSIVGLIRLGKHFNALYYEQCQQVFEQGDTSKYGTSTTALIIGVIVAVLIFIII